MSDRLRRIIGRKRVVLAGLVSLIVLVVLCWKAGWRLEEIGEQFRRIDWSVLALTFVFSALWHMFVGADKWWRILRAQGAPVTYWEVFRVRLGSDPIRLAAPLKVGEVVNAAYFGRLESMGFSRAAGSIAFDKALNFFGTVFWLYVGITAMAEIRAERSFALHTAMAAVVLLLICVRPVRQIGVALAGRLHPKLGRFAAGVLSAFEEFSPLKKIGFLLYGIVFQLRPLVVCCLLFAAFHPSHLPSAQEFLAYGSVVVLMGNMPSLAGIGFREATVMALFSDYATPATLLSVGLLMSFSIQVIPAILGIPLMFPLLRAVMPRAEKARQPAPAVQKAVDEAIETTPGARL